MTTPRIVVLSGSSHRPSKSRALGAAIAAATQQQLPVTVEVFDLVDAGPGLAAFSRKDLGRVAQRIIEAIETADAVIATTPVYKGSYTGLFKHLIDFVDPKALVGKPVVVGATGGGHRHALIVEHQLRPLFGFFSALVVPTAVYASDHEFTDGRVTDPGVLERIELAGSQLALLLAAQKQPTAAHPEIAIAHPERLEVPERHAVSHLRIAVP